MHLYIYVYVCVCVCVCVYVCMCVHIYRYVVGCTIGVSEAETAGGTALHPAVLALLFAMSVLVIACPCAMGLAVLTLLALLVQKYKY